MLQEPASKLKLHALSKLNSLVHVFWREISTSVPAMQATRRTGGGDRVEAKRQKMAVKEEAPSGHVVGDKKQMGGEDVKVAGKEAKKKTGAPVLMYQSPFHSRPGLL